MRDDAPEGYHVTISSCSTLKQLIVSLGYAHQTAAGLIRLSSPSRSNRALYCEPIYGSEVRDIASLAVALWGLYGQVISDGRFSYRAGEWQAFDAGELERIAASLTQEDAEEA
jgi:hypothetical protein